LEDFICPTLRLDIPFASTNDSDDLKDYFSKEVLEDIRIWLLKTVNDGHYYGWVIKGPFTTNKKGFSPSLTIAEVFKQILKRAKSGYLNQYTMIQARFYLFNNEIIYKQINKLLLRSRSIAEVVMNISTHFIKKVVIMLKWCKRLSN
jgi:hypothetical protein